MLHYVRKYVILYYALALLPALIYLASVYFSSGGQGMLSLWTWVSTLVIVVACTFVASRVMNRAASTEVKRLMQLLYEKCDPRSFLEQGADVAGRIKAPFSDWGSLYLCAYGLAYIDIGEMKKAREIVDAMRVSAQASRKPSESAHICLNMHALIKLLYGNELALQCLDEAEATLSEAIASDAEYRDAKDYIDKERSFDIAETLGDDREIITLYGSVRSNERIFRRMRVMAAYHMAEAYRRMGDSEQERESLEFVVANGNKLSVVEKAKARLEALSSPSVPASGPIRS